MPKRYCLDANVLIEAWNWHYSPDLCPSYWDVLKQLGAANVIFLPEEVEAEIYRAEDALSKWLKGSGIPIHKPTADVSRAVRSIMAVPGHERLIDNTRGRSLADPWVIAHAMCIGATVVTREKPTRDPNAKRIKIPDVCYAMGVHWINDFVFLAENSVLFSAQWQQPGKQT